ncbi:MAG: FtsX-like permease family protein [Candidatus Methylacidiphilales bacterium]
MNASWWLGFEGLLAGRYLQPRRSYLSVISVLSFLGVCLGVMTLIVVLSVMGGFEKEMHRKVLGFDPHLTIRNDGILREYAKHGSVLDAEPRVAGWSPFVVGPVLVEINGRISAPQIRAVDPQSIDRVIPLRESLVAGEWFGSAEGVLVGEAWARRNQAWLGDRLLVYSPRNIETLVRPGEGPKTVYLPAEYVITGIFSTGFYDYDFNFLLMRLQEGQRLYHLEDGVHGLAVRLHHMDDVNPVQQALRATMEPGMEVDSWMDLNRTLFSAVAVERRVMTFILFFIMIVAAFGLSGTTLTVVIQKSKEIGLIKALGAANSQVMAVFTLYGFFIGVLGSAAGVGAGALVLRMRHGLSLFLSKIMGVEVFPAEIYHFSELPAVWSWTQTGWIVAAGVVLSTLVAVVPAIMAARVQPARTLHYE